MMDRIFGQGDFRCRLVEDWGTLPEGWCFRQVAAVAVDSHDRVYAYHRGMHPVVVLDSAGTVLSGWGDGVLAKAHGTYIDAQENMFPVDRGGHTIDKYAAGSTRTVRVSECWQPAPHTSDRMFNIPRGVAVAPTGDIYVADSKWNNAVHRFAADGTHIPSWGHLGRGSG